MTTPSIKDYIFYKIFCVDKSVELSYIGSTADWKQRNRHHKSDCNNQNSRAYNYKVYKTIRENGGWGNFKMVEIGKQEQLTPQQAKQIEEKYRVELNADMNDCRCFLTEEEKQEQKKEWRENNPDYNKNWRKNNKEHIQEQKKEWYKNNKEHIKKYNQTESRKAKNVANSKDWRENNPDYNKKYAQTETAKALQKEYNQTDEAKASQKARSKKYRDKKKLEKQQKDITITSS